MPEYRRLRVPGGTYFFTVRLAERGSGLLLQRMGPLREAYAATREAMPFRCDAMVVLPDHLHAIWTLPPGDADFSSRWRMLKSRFSRSLDMQGPRGRSQRAKGERGIWQRRFWEHLVRDPQDYRLHVHYCRTDPVRHGLVASPAEWPHGSVPDLVGSGEAARALSVRIASGRFGE